MHPVPPPQDLEPSDSTIFPQSTRVFQAVGPSPKKHSPSCNPPPTAGGERQGWACWCLPGTLHTKPHLSPVSPFHCSALPPQPCWVKLQSQSRGDWDHPCSRLRRALDHTQCLWGQLPLPKLSAAEHHFERCPQTPFPTLSLLCLNR